MTHSQVYRLVMTARALVPVTLHLGHDVLLCQTAGVVPISAKQVHPLLPIELSGPQAGI
jgi:hypothetical protein